ncbi:hypothetical protein BGX23_011647 [Mortierella sp. AD031]|nr:hypothetical protein BGX23_011647 [Mortierella sp. AD031]KAG0200118.1 hypothetical protein BGX33_011216 [Mortierella sp. NVP41]
MAHTQSDASHINRDIPSAELAQIMTHPDSFRLHYFPLEGQGQTCRDLLTYSGVKWEGTSPKNWMEEKEKTPFGCLPVLYINKGDQEVIISETLAIENYLAKQFGLLGDNEYEETLIRAFHCSSATLHGVFSNSVTWNLPEVQEKTLAAFKARQLVHWVKAHERHLLNNGDNGHYVGNKLSLADIRTANLIQLFSLQPYGDELIEIIKQAPALWKVKATVENDPKLTEWKHSEEVKKISAATKAFYVNPFAASGKPAA